MSVFGCASEKRNRLIDWFQPQTGVEVRLRYSYLYKEKKNQGDVFYKKRG